MIIHANFLYYNIQILHVMTCRKLVQNYSSDVQINTKTFEFSTEKIFLLKNKKVLKSFKKF